MAKIKCSVVDGSFKVEEVVEFERGDVILLEKGTGIQATPSPSVFTLIQCPPADDCPFDKAILLDGLPGSGKTQSHP
jgi:hypothetical protein